MNAYGSKTCFGWHSAKSAKLRTFLQRDINDVMQRITIFGDNPDTPPSEFGDEVYIGEFVRFGDASGSNDPPEAIRAFWQRDGLRPAVYFSLK